MKTIIHRLTTTHLETGRLHKAREAIVDYTRGRITREEAEAAMRAGGWPDAHVQKLLSGAQRHLKFTQH